MLLSNLKLFLRYYFLSLVFFIFFSSLTIYVYIKTKQGVFERKQKLFKHLTQQAENSIQRRMAHYIQILKGARSLLYAIDSVSAQDWREYVNSLKVQENYPGILGIGFAKYIQADELEQHTQEMRSMGFSQYKVFPEGIRMEYTPIIYLEPFWDRNLRAFGYDMYSDPTRRKAMKRARDTNTPAISGTVKLMQETDKNIQAGFLLYLPVYKNGRNPRSIDERRKLLEGYVYNPFRMNDLMDAILLTRELNGIDVEIFDGPIISTKTLIYNKDTFCNFLTKGGFSQGKSTLEIGGNIWSLNFSATPAFEKTSDQNQPLLILIGGFVISALLSLGVGSLSNTRRHALALAEEMVLRFKESEDKVQSIFENAPDAVVVADKNGIITQWNSKAEKLFGWKAEEIIGKTLHDTIIPPQYREAHLKGLKKYLLTGEGPILNRTIELTALNKNNVEFDASLSISATLEKGSPFFIAFISDITERKHAQLELEQKTLALEQSNSELEKFAYVASHDLQEPLRKIHTFGDRLLQKYNEKLPTEGQEYIKRMVTASTRMQTLIDDLLLFSRMANSKEPFIETNFNSIIDDLIRDFEVSIEEKKAQILVDKLPHIEAIPAQIKQLFQNLISNALKFHKKGEAPVIKIRSEIEKRILSTVKKTPLQVCTIYVEDNGIGFDEKYLGQIFVIFQRLHSRAEYHGTGIGLAICRKIVENHKGIITAKSEIGKGTCFIIYLPLKQPEANQKAPPTTPLVNA